MNGTATIYWTKKFQPLVSEGILPGSMEDVSMSYMNSMLTLVPKGEIRAIVVSECDISINALSSMYAEKIVFKGQWPLNHEETLTLPVVIVFKPSSGNED
jgi:hypothetical protein